MNLKQKHEVQKETRALLPYRRMLYLAINYNFKNDKTVVQLDGTFL